MDRHGSRRAARLRTAAARPRERGRGVRPCLSAAARRRPGRPARRRGALPRGRGRLRAGRRAQRRARGRPRVQPDAGGARLPARRLGVETSTRRPAVPRRLGQRGAARRAACASCATRTRSSACAAAPSGAITARRAPGRGAARESVMHFELDRRLAPEELADARGRRARRAGDVRRVVATSRRCASACRRWPRAGPAPAPRATPTRREEAVAFLRWLADDHFVLLGAASTRSPTGRSALVPGSGLGLLAARRARPSRSRVPARRPRRGLRERATEGALLIVSQDEPRCRPCTAASAWTTSACAASRPTARSSASRAWSGCSPRTPTPSPRRGCRCCGGKLRADPRRRGPRSPAPTTTRPRVALFDSFPKDELLAAPTEDLRRAIVALLGAAAPTDVRVLGRRAADGRGASLIVALPRDRYDRRRCASACGGCSRERYGTDRGRAHEVLGEDDRVALHVTVHAPRRAARGRRRASSGARSRALARTWDDRARATRSSSARPRARADARRALGAAPPGVLQGRASTRAGRRTTSSASRRWRPGGETFVVGLQDERRRRRPADARGVLPARAEGRAVAGHADARAPRACA